MAPPFSCMEIPMNRHQTRAAVATQEKKHHHFFAGQVTYSDGKSVSYAHLNCVLTSTDRVVQAKDIGKAQQILQMQFFKRFQGDAEGIEVVDVFMLGISYLGLMTDAHFHEGTSQPDAAAE